MPAEVGVAVVGLGGKGRSHARNLAALPGVRLLALCDVAEEAVARARAELGDAAAAAYGATDPEPVFADPNVAAVVIATQHDSHRPLAVAAARAGKHLLIEKPLALTRADCAAIAAAVASSRVQVVMGFQARYRHFVRLIRERIPAPRVVVGEIIDPKWPDEFWAVDPVRGGGNVLSQGVHTFDLVCYLAGGEPTDVFARGGIFSHDPAVTPTTDTCLGTIAFDNGALASVAIGDFGPLPWLPDKSFYQVFDAQNHSATIYGDRVLFASVDGGERRVEELTEADPVDGPRPDYHGTLRLVEEFVDCARENRPPRIGAGVREGERATLLALAAFESMRTGRPETLGVPARA
ncbi:MAG TPA: Gfo/Idh/MocA family oxidoreductase [Chloroflexota bacterium]|jgi:predicted dehydrogenase|nr:Gfo/Idh/MocA family oxidoreductase [Chloroflexota bacterium]